MEQQLTAFGFIFQAIAIRLYPAIFATDLLKRVPMCDHAQMDVPPPILARNVLMKATGGLVATSGEILFRFIKPIRQSGSREGQPEEKNEIAGSYHGAPERRFDYAADFANNLHRYKISQLMIEELRPSLDLFSVVPIDSDVPSAYLNSNKSLLKCNT